MVSKYKFMFVLHPIHDTTFPSFVVHVVAVTCPLFLPWPLSLRTIVLSLMVRLLVLRRLILVVALIDMMHGAIVVPLLHHASGRVFPAVLQ